MQILKSLCLAFSMYSKLPVPNVYWSRENMRYITCFLPLVGAVTGFGMIIWFVVCQRLNISNICFAAAAAILPVLITGGIHSDGFIDTNDALSSWRGKEKKLEILSDPHVGAFGIISAIVYYMLFFGFLSEVTAYNEIVTISLGFVMSRSICAMEIVLMKTAKDTGMLYELSSSANKAAAIAVNTSVLAACALMMFLISPYIGCAVLFFLTLLVLYYKFFIAKKIDGITGDTSGYFIMICELIITIVIVIGGRLI